jgi:transcriptional regulator with XRE-family HTH domain
MKESKFARGHEPEGPCEAGQTLGMSLESVLKKYLKKRNSILTLLRVAAGLELDELARQLGITKEELEKVETSDDLVSHTLVTKLAKALKVDLKVLMICLGLVKSATKDSIEGTTYYEALPLAAQYSGPDLSKEEKLDLEELFRTILKQLEKNKQNRQ